jgi:hypothetical protein
MWPDWGEGLTVYDSSLSSEVSYSVPRDTGATPPRTIFVYRLKANVVRKENGVKFGQRKKLCDAAAEHNYVIRRIRIDGGEQFPPTQLVLLRHKLRRRRPFAFAPQHGQRDRMTTSFAMSRRRKVEIELGT